MSQPISEAIRVQLGEFAATLLGGAQARLEGTPAAEDLGGFEQATSKLTLAYRVGDDRQVVSVVVKAASNVETKVLQRLSSEGLSAVPRFLGSIEATDR